MINIYAQTFMTATRTGQIRVQDMPPASESQAAPLVQDARYFAIIDPKEL